MRAPESPGLPNAIRIRERITRSLSRSSGRDRWRNRSTRVRFASELSAPARSLERGTCLGFEVSAGFEIVGVCNRRRETATRFAREFDIPKVYGNWEDLIADTDVDAVVIGAWPYLHCPVTLAAFDAGKHVLTQARMALNAREAQRMLDRARESPRLTAMIVPSPYGLTGDAHIRDLIAKGYLGELRELHVHSLNSQLADPSTPITWRQLTRYSGFNMLTLGIVYETVLRWVPPAKRVLAYASKIIPHRFDPEQDKKVRVGRPTACTRSRPRKTARPASTA